LAFRRAAAGASARRDYKKLDIFPAISYSPETKLTLGVIGISYFDLSKGDLATPISFVDFLAVYTLDNQILLESRWEIFTHARQWGARAANCSCNATPTAFTVCDFFCR
jgi:hypothetical protein